MADEEIKVKIVTETDTTKVDALEKKVEDLKKIKLQQKLDVDSSELKEAQERVKSLETFLESAKSNSNIPITITDDDIKNAEAELEALKEKTIDLELKVAKGELETAKAEVESLNGKSAEVKVDVDDSEIKSADSALDGLQNKVIGIAGAIGVVDQMTNMWEASTQRQSSQMFLASKMGADGARKMQGEIQNIVAQVPGDDTFMNAVLTGALAKETSLTTDALSSGASAMADYMMASEMNGKNALEAQQDMKSYILSGSVAELQNSSILSDQVDILKDKNTEAERFNALNEALKAEGYAGVSELDTASKKFTEFQGRMQKATADVGDIFLPLEEGALDLAMSIDDSLGGALMSTFAGLQLAIPAVASGLSMVGDAGLGLKSLSDGAKWIKELGTVQNAWKAIQEALIPVEYAEGTAGWFSIGWIALAIALGIALGLALVWLYNNCDWFRQAVDSLGQALQWLATEIWGAITGAVQWLSNLFQQFTAKLGLNTKDWKQAVLGFILFLPQLPMQIGVALINAIAKVFGFKGNFVQSMISSAQNAVTGFASSIVQLPGKLATELNNMLSLVGEWSSTLPQKFWDAGVNAVKNFLNALGIHSPGIMQTKLLAEVSDTGERIPNKSRNLLDNIGKLGEDVVDEFGDPVLGLRFEDTANSRFFSQNDDDIVGGGDFIFNMYGNVDDENRIKEIADAVTEVLRFDNKKAGRSI